MNSSEISIDTFDVSKETLMTSVEPLWEFNQLAYDYTGGRLLAVFSYSNPTLTVLDATTGENDQEWRFPTKNVYAQTQRYVKCNWVVNSTYYGSFSPVSSDSTQIIMGLSTVDGSLVANNTFEYKFAPCSYYSTGDVVYGIHSVKNVFYFSTLNYRNFRVIHLSKLPFDRIDQGISAIVNYSGTTVFVFTADIASNTYLVSVDLTGNIKSQSLLMSSSFSLEGLEAY